MKPDLPVHRNANVTDAVSGLFVDVLCRLGKVWLVAAGVACVIQWLVDPASLAECSAIAFGSGLISTFALLPGALLKHPEVDKSRQPKRSDSSFQANLILIGSVAAMAIRFAGTVALFVACRYQFGLTTETVAILVCSWYVLLTSVEIFFLARGASAIDRVRALSSQTPLTESTIG